jgi:hypothetical protein
MAVEYLTVLLCVWKRWRIQRLSQQTDTNVTLRGLYYLRNSESGESEENGRVYGGLQEDTNNN